MTKSFEPKIVLKHYPTSQPSTSPEERSYKTEDNPEDEEASHGHCCTEGRLKHLHHKRNCQPKNAHQDEHNWRSRSKTDQHRQALRALGVLVGMDETDGEQDGEQLERHAKEEKGTGSCGGGH